MKNLLWSQELANPNCTLCQSSDKNAWSHYIYATISNDHSYGIYGEASRKSWVTQLGEIVVSIVKKFSFISNVD